MKLTLAAFLLFSVPTLGGEIVPETDFVIVRTADLHTLLDELLRVKRLAMMVGCI